MRTPLYAYLYYVRTPLSQFSEKKDRGGELVFISQGENRRGNNDNNQPLLFPLFPLFLSLSLSPLLPTAQPFPRGAIRPRAGLPPPPTFFKRFSPHLLLPTPTLSKLYSIEWCTYYTAHSSSKPWGVSPLRSLPPPLSSSPQTPVTGLGGIGREIGFLSPRDSLPNTRDWEEKVKKVF